jgi:hypothetical protein
MERNDQAGGGGGVSRDWRWPCIPNKESATHPQQGAGVRARQLRIHSATGQEHQRRQVPSHASFNRERSGTTHQHAELGAVGGGTHRPKLLTAVRALEY